MYLKSIEIQGFKSFANKTLFEFHNGITCIVGPNGSGKSNVADAVRWVLGEQSAKQLRGSNMQDVIFAGTELRKPQGFASVAITFDNSDHVLNIGYDEVTVTRRVYRSGESEYLLNKTECRLKDINELFFDTGIGKEGYSIIGQGQIDRILSSRPEDRRELFDEAAGIVKFKYRKAAAQKKLDSEEANMVRLGDILKELEKQTGPLGRQAEAAKEYLKLREELKDYEIRAFAADSRKLEAALTELEEKLKVTGADYDSTKKACDQLKEQYDRGQSRMEELEKEAEGLRQKKDSSQEEWQEKESRIRVLKEQITYEGLKREQTRERIELLEKRKTELTAEIAGLEEKQKELSGQMDELSFRRSRTAAGLEELSGEIAKLQDFVREGQGNVIRLLNHRADLMTQNEKYETLLGQYKIQKAAYSGQFLTLQGEEKKHAETCRERKEALEQAEQNLKKAQDALKEKEALVTELRGRQKDLQVRISQESRDLQIASTRADSLRNLAERYEGYGSGIKKVMETKGRVPGICGVISELIHVDRKYETAVETALGGAIQNVVTETEQTARNLIEYLKENRFGRVTFLPLDSITIHDGFRQKEVLKEPGIIGMADSLTQTDPKYRKVMEFLLGKIVVADNIDNAMRTAAKYKRSFRIVTLEGDLLNIGGSMTGGAFKNSSNLLGRNRELEELEKEVLRLKKTLQKSEEEQKKVSEAFGQAEKEYSAMQSAASAGLLSRTEAFRDYELACLKQKEALKAEEDIRLQLGLLGQSIRETEESRDAVKAEIDEIEKAGDRNKDDSDAFQKELEEKLLQKEEMSASLQEQDLDLARLAQSKSFSGENRDRLKKEEEKNQKDAEEERQSILDFEQIREEKEEEIRKLQMQAEEKEKLTEELDEKLSEISRDREAVNASLKKYFTDQQELSSRMNLLDRDLLRMNAQKEKYEESLNRQTDYLWNEYGVRASEAKAAVVQSTADPAREKGKIQELKGKIKALGNVNVNSIAEYRELMERYTFMKSQYDDLVSSRGELMSVIKDLDAGMRTQFQEKFAEIQTEFNRVFQEMFGGGKGSLELMEGEDILDAGIAIISQPPGKKLQNMMQLSGGEKALTAIALLFAIQNLKPSPFCLLDEIEAALDDPNVGRFAKYLHKLTQNTQFIVITHRKGTMTAADRLYGITMQEKGVSALVSVSLVEQQLSKNG